MLLSWSIFAGQPVWQTLPPAPFCKHFQQLQQVPQRYMALGTSYSSINTRKVSSLQLSESRKHKGIGSRCSFCTFKLYQPFQNESFWFSFPAWCLLPTFLASQETDRLGRLQLPIQSWYPIKLTARYQSKCLYRLSVEIKLKLCNWPAPGQLTSLEQSWIMIYVYSSAVGTSLHFHFLNTHLGRDKQITGNTLSDVLTQSDFCDISLLLR